MATLQDGGVQSDPLLADHHMGDVQALGDMVMRFMNARDGRS